MKVFPLGSYFLYRKYRSVPNLVSRRLKQSTAVENPHKASGLSLKLVSTGIVIRPNAAVVEEILNLTKIALYIVLVRGSIESGEIALRSGNFYAENINKRAL